MTPKRTRPKKIRTMPQNYKYSDNFDPIFRKSEPDQSSTNTQSNTKENSNEQKI